MPDGSLQILVSPPLGYVFAALWGALWGSFFNVAIYRLAREDASLKSLVWPPSHCPACQAPIRSIDNVPLLSWLLLRGRCRRCHAPISARYPLVELASLLLALAVFHVLVVGHAAPASAKLARFLVYFFFTGTLLVLSVIDLDTMLLPEAITLPSIPLFFLGGRVVGDVSWSDALIGAAVGFGSLKALQIGYFLLRKREGLGGGDATLMALVGGLLGWRALPFSLGLGSLLGTLVTVPLMLLGRWRGGAANNIAPQHDALGENGAVQGKVAAPQHEGRGAQIAALQGRDAAAQQDDAASQQGDADPADDQPEDLPLWLREVPFGPFLVAGTLLYLFFKDAAWAWLVGYYDVP